MVGDRGWLVLVPELDHVLWRQRIRATCARLKAETEAAHARAEVRRVIDDYLCGW